MSDTPRMDAIWAQNYCSGGDAAGKTWDMIRDLDRELAAAQDEIKRLRGKCAAIEGNEIGYPCVALSEAQAQRDEMKLALRDLTDAFGDYGGLHSQVYRNMKEVYDLAAKPLTEKYLDDLCAEYLCCQEESPGLSGVYRLIRAVERAHGIGVK